MSVCTKRSSRSAVTLVIIVLGVYLPVSLFFMASERSARLTGTANNALNGVFNSEVKGTGPVSNAVLHAIHHNSKAIAQMNVRVKSVIPSVNGTVDLVLSLKVQDILKNIDQADMNNGEATANGIPYNPGFVIPNKDLCKKSQGLQYIIYIHTSPANNERRKNIRSTWGNKYLFKDGRTNIVFIMGVPEEKHLKEEVLKESEIYQDIVQADFTDVYKNLTLKGIAGLKWLSLYCKEAEQAIKADDDAFVNIFELLHILDKYRKAKSASDNDKNKVIACPLWGENSMPILRDPTKCMKWCVKYNEFPGQSYFPKYCAGLSFSLSMDMIIEMYEKSKTTPFFWVDDVYITGLLPGKVKNVQYVSLLKHFTLKEKIALEEYNSTKPVNYYMVHIRTPSNFPIIWEMALRRLNRKQLSQVDERVYKSFPNFFRKQVR